MTRMDAALLAFFGTIGVVVLFLWAAVFFGPPGVATLAVAFVISAIVYLESMG